jgi:hypothetical protein
MLTWVKTSFPLVTLFEYGNRLLGCHSVWGMLMVCACYAVERLASQLEALEQRLQACIQTTKELRVAALVQKKSISNCEPGAS